VDEALELALPPSGHYADSWSRYTPVKPIETADNHLRWEIKDMPGLDLENVHATPSWDALAARMTVMWGDEAVNGTENQWRAFGLWEDQIEAHRPDPTPEIIAKAQELTAGAPDLYTKLNRITTYIQKNIRYFIIMKGIGGWQAHYAADIYRNRYGDCKDKTTLLISNASGNRRPRPLPGRRRRRIARRLSIPMLQRISATMSSLLLNFRKAKKRSAPGGARKGGERQKLF